jgi:hypothetical protein
LVVGIFRKQLRDGAAGYAEPLRTARFEGVE